MEVEVPCSLAGIAIAEPCMLGTADGAFIYYVELIRCYAMLFFFYAIQAFFLYQLWTIDHETSECNLDLIPLMLICCFVFSCSIFRYVCDTMSIFWVIYHAPNLASGSYTNVKDTGAVMAHHTKWGRFVKKFKPALPPNAPPRWKFKGLSTRYKIWSISVVWLPRIVAAIVLAYLGGLFIVKNSTAQEMLLNTMAVNFILEIDDILYISFTSEAVMSALADMDPVVVEMTNDSRWRLWFLNTAIFPPLTMVSSVGMLLGASCISISDILCSVSLGHILCED
eukprot:TRINITY_DN4328_c0_g1_i2.p1 TRINITY_DN4328_c0_g1~~TRINITY_DN4328_c0_g1_i2.p1  ORF type:complete len:320 (+),score=27.99 TRINITY_DN4328_c0_g1_i2:118-960(+)